MVLIGRRSFPLHFISQKVFIQTQGNVIMSSCKTHFLASLCFLGWRQFLLKFPHIIELSELNSCDRSMSNQLNIYCTWLLESRFGHGGYARYLKFQTDWIDSKLCQCKLWQCTAVHCKQPIEIAPSINCPNVWISTSNIFTPNWDHIQIFFCRLRKTFCR